ncbi:MAG: DUF4349 domain-containing protein [Pseudomonadota bacterium]
MKKLVTALLILVAIAGCSDGGKLGRSAPMAMSKPSANSPSRYLAYEHSIQIDAEEGKVAAIYAAGQAACRDAAADLCTVLESRINSGRAASASLKFRTTPGGIGKLIAALSQQGEVTEQSTSAEDLASPIADAAKKLAMLTDYQAKLEALRARASTDVDALIKVNRELAQVQSELEDVAGKRAHLVQRVETQILNVTISADHKQSFFKPISLAMSDFGTNLSQGVSSAIIGLAFLIPWGLVFALFVWIGRTLWRRRKQKSAGQT